MDRRIFETYLETQLAPTLRPGDVVVLDNLPADKSAAAEQAVRAMRAWLLFLPPYSPDLVSRLVDNDDPGAPRRSRRSKAQLAAGDDDPAAVGRGDPGRDFGERRLPGTVCAHQRDDFSAADGEIDILKRLCGAESL